MTLVIGDGVSGAARWIPLGPFQFQFSELAKILMIIVLANYLANRAGQARIDLDDPRRLRPGGPRLDPDHEAARPRDLARAGRDPGRDAVHVRGEHPLVGRPGRRDRGGGPHRLDLSPARLPEAATAQLPRPRGGSAGLGLSAAPEPDLGRFRRAAGQGADQRYAEPARLPPRPDDRLRVRAGSPRSSASSGRS